MLNRQQRRKASRFYKTALSMLVAGTLAAGTSIMMDIAIDAANTSPDTLGIAGGGGGMGVSGAGKPGEINFKSWKDGTLQSTFTLGLYPDEGDPNEWPGYTVTYGKDYTEGGHGGSASVTNAAPLSQGLAQLTVKSGTAGDSTNPGNGGDAIFRAPSGKLNAKAIELTVGDDDDGGNPGAVFFSVGTLVVEEGYTFDITGTPSELNINKFEFDLTGVDADDTMLTVDGSIPVRDPYEIWFTNNYEDIFGGTPQFEEEDVIILIDEAVVTGMPEGGIVRNLKNVPDNKEGVFSFLIEEGSLTATVIPWQPDTLKSTPPPTSSSSSSSGSNRVNPENYVLSYMRNRNVDDHIVLYTQNAPVSNSNLVILRSIPTREGYTFLHWTPDREGKGTKYRAGDLIAIFRDTELFAQWELNAPPVIEPEEPAPVNDNPKTGL